MESPDVVRTPKIIAIFIWDLNIDIAYFVCERICP